MLKAGTARGLLVAMGLAAVAGVSLTQATALPEVVGIRDQDVTDIETARDYLAQEIELYLPDGPTEMTGDFRFGPVAGATVEGFLRQQGIVDEAWDAAQPFTATVVSWTSPDVEFRAPRPRAGFDARLTGDTFFVILAPSGLKLSGVLSSDDLAPLWVAASGVVEEQLTISVNQ